MTFPLGRNINYPKQYEPRLLFPVSRALQRNELFPSDELPFYGVDIWNAYEISCLNQKGKPMVAIGQFIVPCQSNNLIESKSLKLYLNSLNNKKFTHLSALTACIQRDLSCVAESAVKVFLHDAHSSQGQGLHVLKGLCLDEQDIDCDTYTVNAEFLMAGDNEVQETVYSHLLKSNCPVTGQPDWASVVIHYQGMQIDHAGLLRYIVSFREHTGFHENCVERMFVDIMQKCRSTSLTVEARYTRRGGLDINPIRSTERGVALLNQRLFRQ